MKNVTKNNVLVYVVIVSKMHGISKCSIVTNRFIVISCSLIHIIALYYHQYFISILI